MALSFCVFFLCDFIFWLETSIPQNHSSANSNAGENAVQISLFWWKVQSFHIMNILNALPKLEMVTFCFNLIKVTVYCGWYPWTVKKPKISAKCVN